MNIETNIPGFVIRTATPDDCGQILQFVRALAEYEKLLHKVVATEEILQKHLFGDHPTAEVIIGEADGSPVGFALFFQNFSTFLGQPGIYLEDLFVSPAQRGKGYGKALLACLAQIAIDRQCGRLEWSVLDWNTPAIEFYQSLGAETMDGWKVNRLSGDHLTAVADAFPPFAKGG